MYFILIEFCSFNTFMVWVNTLSSLGTLFIGYWYVVPCP